MAISLYNIKKWYRMLAGKSILHVNQKKGRYFTKGKLSGYYNDMTQKVLLQPDLLNSDKLPTVIDERNNEVVFPVAIFQYGLGAYDLFIETQKLIYLKKFEQCANWALENQEDNGAWNNFFFVFPDSPYGAMAQGEGISLLCRAYAQFGNDIFLKAARKALDFMLLSTTKGGTTQYLKDDIILLEITKYPAVLNGWIFAWWGLYDYSLICKESKLDEIINKSLITLEKYLPQFNNRLWSLYDLDGHVASPFYHRLHIAQLQAMYQLTGIEIFNEYSILWRKRENSKLKYFVSFIQKAFQKIRD